MLLSDINRYFTEHERACLADLANHFKADSDAIIPMLDMLARKGRIRKLESNSNCGGCSKCDPDRLIVYERVRS